MAACSRGVASVTICRLPRHRLQGTNSTGGPNRGWERKSSYICRELLLSIHLPHKLIVFPARIWEHPDLPVKTRRNSAAAVMLNREKKTRGIKKRRGPAWALFAEGGRIKGSEFRAFRWISIQAQTGWCYRSGLISGLECFGGINVHIKAGTDALPDRKKEKRGSKCSIISDDSDQWVFLWQICPTSCNLCDSH